MNLYETSEESLRRFLTLLEELEDTPLAPVLEEEVSAPMRLAFCALLPEEGRDVDSLHGAFSEYKHTITNHQTRL